MKQKAYILSLSVATALAALSACGDDSSTGNHAEEPQNIVPMDSVATDDDLPSCTEKRQETAAFVEEDSSIRICLNEKWEEVESVAATKDDLPNCSDKRKGVTAYVLDEHGFLTCIDGRWKSENSSDKSSSSEKTDASSSSSEKDNSSSDKVSSAKDESSSSVETTSSSSEKEDESSSSSQGTDKPAKNSLTATIYDTDESLNKFFSTYPNNESALGWYVTQCVGVFTGLVETNLGEDGKPQLNEESENAAKCFENQEGFATLFNYTEDVNEVVAWEMPYAQNDDGIWMFNSDSTKNGDDFGGFFPIENTSDDDVLTVEGKKLGPLEAARKKRNGEAPYFLKDDVDFYHYCMGPGWQDGEDCNGSFKSPEFWDTTIPQWIAAPRNHHFCMEIHGTFTYSDTQEAGFSASGDQWVFIGGKLAVDNGGTHANAPGFVQMKTLNDSYNSFMKKGEKYSIDVFYCARRTRLSDFSMWTNFPITQE